MDDNSSVKLLRVHYYDASKQLRNIATISQNVYLQEQTLWKSKPKPNKIRRSIFGHKWILEINQIEDDNKNKCHWNVLVVFVVIFSFVIAVFCGIYFSSYNSTVFVVDETANISSIHKIVKIIWNLDLHKRLIPNNSLNANNRQIDNGNPNATSSFKYCEKCIRPKNVCLQLTPDGPPTCEVSRDSTDLTGCGGFCLINTQYCKLLHKEHLVYECLKNYYTFECLDDGFNCGNSCIPNNKICDGFINCPNKSDELNCACELDDHFRCSENISCFKNLQKCDGKVDCWDASDEIGCSSTDCLSTEVACINGGCIHLDMFCNGVPDCEDKSDEPFGCEINAVDSL